MREPTFKYLVISLGFPYLGLRYSLAKIILVYTFPFCSDLSFILSSFLLIHSLFPSSKVFAHLQKMVASDFYNCFSNLPVNKLEIQLEQYIFALEPTVIFISSCSLHSFICLRISLIGGILLTALILSFCYSFLLFPVEIFGFLEISYNIDNSRVISSKFCFHFPFRVCSFLFKLSFIFLISYH